MAWQVGQAAPSERRSLRTFWIVAMAKSTASAVSPAFPAMHSRHIGRPTISVAARTAVSGMSLVRRAGRPVRRALHREDARRDVARSTHAMFGVKLQDPRQPLKDDADLIDRRPDAHRDAVETHRPVDDQGGDERGLFGHGATRDYNRGVRRPLGGPGPGIRGRPARLRAYTFVTIAGGSSPRARSSACASSASWSWETAKMRHWATLP